MNQKELAYMCAATKGMMAQGLEPPMIPRPKKPETKYDKKKCKSCRCFDKERLKDRIYVCRAKRECYSPLQVSCNLYKKRKR